MKILNRRAVSPVVATILMFVLTMAAIGISLVYMLPSISNFKDKVIIIAITSILLL
ncbi:MAG: hypothetical protein ACTSP3_16770 [Candidatus Heimdallarchaeaceae archaeon]